MTETTDGGGRTTECETEIDYDTDFDLENPETLEQVRTALTIWKCFDGIEEIKDKGFHHGMDSRTDAMLDTFIHNPCCSDRRVRHLMESFGRLCMTLGFQAGARSGNLQIEGLHHDSAPIVTDEEIHESNEQAKEVEAKREAEARERARLVFEKLGLDHVEMPDGARAIVVKSPEEMNELLSALAGRNGGNEDDRKFPGMYL